MVQGCFWSVFFGVAGEPGLIIGENVCCGSVDFYCDVPPPLPWGMVMDRGGEVLPSRALLDCLLWYYSCICQSKAALGEAG